MYRNIYTFLVSLLNILNTIENGVDSFYQELQEIEDHLNEISDPPMSEAELVALFNNIYLYLSGNNTHTFSRIIPDSYTLHKLPEVLTQYYLESSPVLNKHSATSSLVEKAEILARREFHLPIGLAQVAEELQVTPNYLSFQFKQIKGLGFNQFLTELRMERASDLLLSSNFSIKEIAEKVGYTGSRHFARKFRDRYSLSPSAFLDRYRRK